MTNPRADGRSTHATRPEVPALESSLHRLRVSCGSVISVILGLVFAYFLILQHYLSSLRTSKPIENF